MQKKDKSRINKNMCRIKKDIVFIINTVFVGLLLLSSCQKNIKKEFKYPDSKVWKHGVYSKYEAAECEGVFKGLEVDLVYLPDRDDIYIGRSEEDAPYNDSFDDWLAILEKPQELSFWLDFKNLNSRNCKKALARLDKLTSKYNIKDVVMIESQDIKPLKYAQQEGYHVILWVDDLFWRRHERQDSIEVCRNIRKKINTLRPDAISGSYRMYPILCDTFPEQNIHYWDTPKDYSEENAEFTRELCRNHSVKVVLVNYDKPIDY